MRPWNAPVQGYGWNHGSRAASPLHPLDRVIVSGGLVYSVRVPRGQMPGRTPTTGVFPAGVEIGCNDTGSYTPKRPGGGTGRPSFEHQQTEASIQMIPINPYTPEAEAILEVFLSRPSNPKRTYCIGEVHGFLFAVTAAPDVVKPSAWLPFICGGKEPHFDSREEARQVMGAFMSLFNEINDAIRDKRMPPGCEFRDDVLANLEPDAPISQWSRGFAAGHIWLAESWEAYVPEELKEDVGTILGTLAFFSSRSQAKRIVDEADKPDVSLESFATMLRDVFPKALTGYAATGRAIWRTIYKEGQAGRKPTVADGRIGRNEPCPCGSGKKHKKCCGATAN